MDEEKLDFGKTSEHRSYNEGKLTSITKVLTRSIKIVDKYDAQAKILDAYKLLETGKTKDLTLHLVADDNFVPKRLEVTMVTEKKNFQAGSKK